jgi:hypothetical protein
MQDYVRWWQQLPKGQKDLWLVTCYVLIFYGAIDVGRSLYQVTH